MFEISGIGAAGAFLAGLVSFLSPCVLPIVPGYLSYVAGRSLVDPAHEDLGSRAKPVGLGLCFVLGFATIFIGLGASATAIGQALLRYRYETNIVGGVIIVLFGLVLAGLLKVPWLERGLHLGRALKGGHPVAAYLLGAAFGFGWTPCIGPILGAILTISAAGATASSGIALLTIYALGLGVPFLAVAAFTEQFLKRVRLLRGVGRVLHPIAGVVLILIGLAILTDRSSTLSYWLLDTFPVLARIG